MKYIVQYSLMFRNVVCPKKKEKKKGLLCCYSPEFQAQEPNHFLKKKKYHPKQLLFWKRHTDHN